MRRPGSRFDVYRSSRCSLDLDSDFDTRHSFRTTVVTDNRNPDQVSGAIQRGRCGRRASDLSGASGAPALLKTTGGSALATFGRRNYLRWFLDRRRPPGLWHALGTVSRSLSRSREVTETETETEEVSKSVSRILSRSPRKLAEMASAFGTVQTLCPPVLRGVANVPRNPGPDGIC